MLGKNQKYILFKNFDFCNIRISTELIEDNRKSILIIQKMDISIIGPYLCQTNESISTIILQLTSIKINIFNYI